MWSVLIFIITIMLIPSGVRQWALSRFGVAIRYVVFSPAIIIFLNAGACFLGEFGAVPTAGGSH